MPRSRADYDAIAHLYDEPLRDHQPDHFLQAFVSARSASEAPPTIADFGCGTGKWIAANLGVCPSGRFIGLDRSRGMLQVAVRRLPGVPLVHGDWAALPLATGSVNFVRSTFAYHFVEDKQAMLGETRRALRPGGRFVLTDIDPWSMERWAVYRFFPESRALDEQDFLPANRLAAMAREAGFEQVVVTRHLGTSTQELRDFLAYAEQRHRASQLRALTDEAYQRGLESIRAAVRIALQVTPTIEPSIESEFCLVHVAATRPDGA